MGGAVENWRKESRIFRFIKGNKRERMVESSQGVRGLK